MRLDERHQNACVDPKDIAGGRQAESRCPEVEADFAHEESGPSHPALDMAALAEVTRANDAWNSTRGQGIDIALVDTGVAPVAGLGPVVNGPDLSFDVGDPTVQYTWL